MQTDTSGTMHFLFMQRYNSRGTASTGARAILMMWCHVHSPLLNRWRCSQRGRGWSYTWPTAHLFATILWRLDLDRLYLVRLDPDRLVDVLLVDEPLEEEPLIDEQMAHVLEELEVPHREHVLLEPVVNDPHVPSCFKLDGWLSSRTFLGWWPLNSSPLGWSLTNSSLFGWGLVEFPCCLFTVPSQNRGCQSKPSYHFFQTHTDNMVSCLWILTWTNVFHRLDDGSACVYQYGCWHNGGKLPVLSVFIWYTLQDPFHRLSLWLAHRWTSDDFGSIRDF